MSDKIRKEKVKELCASEDKLRRLRKEVFIRRTYTRPFHLEEFENVSNKTLKEIHDDLVKKIGQLKREIVALPPSEKYMEIIRKYSGEEDGRG